MFSLASYLKQQQREQLAMAVEWAGSQTNLGKLLGVSPQVVNNWVSRGRISATSAAELEKQSKGLFKKVNLRPDVTEWRV